MNSGKAGAATARVGWSVNILPPGCRRKADRFQAKLRHAQKRACNDSNFRGGSELSDKRFLPGFAGTPARLPWRVLCFWFLVSPEGFGRDAKSVRVTRESDDASDSCPSDCKNHRNIRHDRASVATARYAATAGRSRRPTQTAWAARPAGAVMRGVSRSGLHR
jgi:hypothetical protein